MHVHVHVHVQVHVGGRVMSATSVAELHTHMYGHPWAHAHTTLICTLIIINHDRLSPTLSTGGVARALSLIHI